MIPDTSQCMPCHRVLLRALLHLQLLMRTFRFAMPLENQLAPSP
jgi:hypothetical protein